MSLGRYGFEHLPKITGTHAHCPTMIRAFDAAAVAADLLGRDRAARVLGAATAVVGGYVGSYTGVLPGLDGGARVGPLAAVPGAPIFVSTATATGAAACRLALVARGLPVGHPTRDALGSVETGAMAAELLLSTINERRLGPLARGLEEGAPGRLFRAAKWSVRAGLALRLARERGGPRTHHVASVLYLLAGLLFRFAWVEAGPPSAHDDRVVAEMARSRRHGT